MWSHKSWAFQYEVKKAFEKVANKNRRKAENMRMSWYKAGDGGALLLNLLETSNSSLNKTLAFPSYT
jgi:hypothetical protein